jgi:hypothetical protein
VIYLSDIGKSVLLKAALWVRSKFCLINDLSLTAENIYEIIAKIRCYKSFSNNNNDTAPSCPKLSIILTVMLWVHTYRHLLGKRS